MTVQIKPIRSDRDYKIALAEVSRLMDLRARSRMEEDALEVLGALVEAWEKEHFPIEGPGDPIDALKAHMDMSGRTQTDLAKLLGARSRAAEILNRRRGLSLEMIRRLHEQWGLPLEILVQEPTLRAGERVARYRKSARKK